MCSGKNFDLVRSLGADELIDHTKADFAKTGKKYDYIYDTIGKSSFSKCKEILAERGKYLSPVLKISLLAEMLKTTGSQKKALFQATGTKGDEHLRKLLGEVLEIYKAGKLKTIIDKKYRLGELAEAHRYIERGHKKGNVIVVNSDV